MYWSLLAEVVGALVVAAFTAGLYRLMRFARRQAGVDPPLPRSSWAVDSRGLLTADEIGAALGRSVRGQTVPGLEMVSTTIFRPARGRGQVMLVQTSWGRMGAVVRWLHARGQPLTGVGDGAFVRGRRAIAWMGGTTVMLTRKRKGRGLEPHLPRLLSQAVARTRARIFPGEAVGA